MNLWSFIFTDPTSPWTAARVAAPNKMAAALVLEAWPSAPLLSEHPAICQFLGLIDWQVPGMVLITIRDPK